MGIIPARAGFTCARAVSLRSPRDHPRSRGVYIGTFSYGANDKGSSPLARGLPSVEIGQLREFGIIPARAGFTPPPVCDARHIEDHPRSRGVYAAQRSAVRPSGGSSPLARGLRARTCAGRGGPGIIPARAGFTRQGAGRGHRRQDHPRSRGVYLLHTPHPPSRVGSSPLARGLPRSFHVKPLSIGIIPARAGFTATGQPVAADDGDHPRSRGVYEQTNIAGHEVQGSSPLARGLRAQTRSCVARPRIIPARAGFTRSGTGTPSPDSDHPRSRGVYSTTRGPI